MAKNDRRWPQWQYFDLPFEIFDDEILNCSSFINDLALVDTFFYRNILYAFCKYQKFISFRFRQNPTITPSQFPYDIEVIFRNNHVKRKFFELAVMNNSQRQNEFGDKEFGIPDFCKRLNDFIQLYTNQFINDLFTVSQPHGYVLFSEIYSPPLIKSYYNVMGISLILMKEHNKLLQCYGPEHSFVVSVRSFLSRCTDDLSEEIFFFVWTKIGRDYPQDFYVPKLMQKFQWQKADFYNEMMFLDHRFKKLGFEFQSGPQILDYNPSILAGESVYHKPGIPIPSYKRMNVPNGTTVQKFQQFDRFLSYWSENGKQNYKETKSKTAPPKFLERKQQRQFVNEQSNEISSSNMSRISDQSNHSQLSSSKPSSSLPICENVDEPILKTAKYVPQTPSSDQDSCDVLVLFETEPQRLPSKQNDISELDFATIEVEKNKARTLAKEAVVSESIDSSFKEKTRRSLGDETKFIEKTKETDSKERTAVRKTPLCSEGKNKKSPEKKMRTSISEKSHTRSSEQRKDLKSVDRKKKRKQVSPTSPKNIPADVSTKIKTELYDSPLSPGKELSDLPLMLTNGAILKKIKLDKTYSDKVVEKKLDFLENKGDLGVKSSVSELQVQDVVVKSEKVEEEIYPKSVEIVKPGTKIKSSSAKNSSNKSKKDENSKKDDKKSTAKKQASHKVDNIKDTLLYQSVSGELAKFMSTKDYKNQFYNKKRSGSFREKDKEAFLRFLFEHHFLCEVMNPSLPEILCNFKFLSRQETTPYENFLSDLRSNLSLQLENLFPKSSDKSIKFVLYESLRKKFG